MADRERCARAPVHSCGECTLCCTLMRVTAEWTKPERATCDHCSASGCEIYADRPEVCSTFECLWLASQRRADLALPPRMRPDVAGVVIDLNSAMTVIAHCEREDSWSYQPMRSWLLHQAQRTTVILERPSGAAVLYLDGTTENLIKIGVDPSSNNRLYVRQSEAHKIRAADLQLLNAAGCSE